MRRIGAVALDVALSPLEGALTQIPGGLGRRLRRVYYHHRLKHLGRGVVIDAGVRILNPQYVSIGDHTWIDSYVLIVAGPPPDRGGPLKRRPNPAYTHAEGEVVIGNNCHISPFAVLQGHGGLSIGNDCGVAGGCFIYSMSHHHTNPDDHNDRTPYKISPMAAPSEQMLIVSPVVMQDGSALGLNSVLLPGAVVQEGTWVGANSVVSCPIPAYCIALGNPARVVQKRLR